jgi:hypothetical protein
MVLCKNSAAEVYTKVTPETLLAIAQAEAKEEGSGYAVAGCGAHTAMGRLAISAATVAKQILHCKGAI